MSYIKTPHILVPAQDVDKSKWSVVACDQFTSQPHYWEDLSLAVGDSPSTLNLIFPEVYLEQDDAPQRIANIHATMRSYLNGGMFESLREFVLVDRTLSDGKHRIGLMVAIDLETYEYTPDSAALIRATEKTVVSRIPARIEIRRNACIEVPHIMLLMDDRDDSVLGPLMAKRDTLQRLYDFDLNMNGGHVCGYVADDPDRIKAAVARLLDPQVLRAKYGDAERPVLFAVGDGNHSLASAKECWNQIKTALSAAEQQRHPARYALCELVNLHDTSLVFQPIHRVVMGADREFIDWLRTRMSGDSSVRLVWRAEEFTVQASSSPSDAIADLQKAIDDYCRAHREIAVDYIHGEDNLLEVAREKDAIAIFMPTIDKNSLFDYVRRRGVLPRKSFSMGNAEDKRYYYEAKKIKW